MSKLRLIFYAVALLCGCSRERHQKLHYSLALNNAVWYGSSIGVVVDELRTENALPIEQQKFLDRYGKAFRIGFGVSTTKAGDLELACGNGIVWLVSTRDGATHILRSTNTELPDIVSLFKAVDFSKPLSASNMPAVSPELRPGMTNVADMNWETYPRKQK
jgi:hypothetical protein